MTDNNHYRFWPNPRRVVDEMLAKDADTSTILPCFHCGNGKMILNREPMGHFVVCDVCGIRGSRSAFEHYAIQDYNKIAAIIEKHQPPSVLADSQRSEAAVPVSELREFIEEGPISCNIYAMNEFEWAKKKLIELIRQAEEQK